MPAEDEMSTNTLWRPAAILFLILVSAQVSAQGTAWQMHMGVGVKAYQQGRYSDAERSFRAAVKEAQGFGPQDPRLALSLNNLAELPVQPCELQRSAPGLPGAPWPWLRLWRTEPAQFCAT